MWLSFSVSHILTWLCFSELSHKVTTLKQIEVLQTIMWYMNQKIDVKHIGHICKSWYLGLLCISGKLGNCHWYIIIMSFMSRNPVFLEDIWFCNILLAVGWWFSKKLLGLYGKVGRLGHPACRQAKHRDISRFWSHEFKEIQKYGTDWG